jgi:hypothetical protein
VLKIFHAQKNDMDFYKIFAKEKIFIKPPYYGKKKKREKKIPTPFLQPPIPHHQRKNSLKNQKTNPNLPPRKKIKLLSPMPSKKVALG